MFNSQLSFLIIFAGNGILRGKAGGSTTSAVFRQKLSPRLRPADDLPCCFRAGEPGRPNSTMTHRLILGPGRTILFRAKPAKKLPAGMMRVSPLCRTGQPLSAIYGQAQDLHHLPGDQMAAFFGYAAHAIIELRLWQKVNLVTTNHCFPIESVRLVQ